MSIKESHRYVIVFDGYCNLCSRSAMFIIKRDREKKFRLIPSQSPMADPYKAKFNMEEISGISVVLIDEGKIYHRSDAVLRILGHLGFPWNLFSVLRILPAGARDLVYRIVAKKRLKWFGRRDECFIPDD